MRGFIDKLCSVFSIKAKPQLPEPRSQDTIDLIAENYERDRKAEYQRYLGIDL